MSHNVPTPDEVGQNVPIPKTPKERKPRPSRAVPKPPGWVRPQNKHLIPGHGRYKGGKNKFTNLKNAFLNAFNRIGGEDELTDFARKKGNQALFFQLLSKMLPTKAETSGKVTLEVIYGNRPELPAPDVPLQIEVVDDAGTLVLPMPEDND